MRNTKKLFAVLAMFCVLLSTGAVLADGEISNVYVYNGGDDDQGAGDVFNNAAKGWIFEQMGLLGDNGEFPEPGDPDQGQDVDGLYDADGEQVGTILRDEDDNIIGYEGADGKQRAYNVDTSATVADAWGAVADGGRLTIAKHGGRLIERGEVIGTGITLDDGNSYPGFTEKDEAGGTGAPVKEEPYPLPPRPDAGITVDLNACYSSLDADPDDDEKQSATDSAEDVPGVGATEGHEGVTRKLSSITWVAPDPDAFQVASDALVKCAADAGFKKKNDAGDEEGDFTGWADSLAPQDQHGRLNQCLKDAGIDTDTITITITYEKNPDDGGAEGKGYYLCPTMLGTDGGNLIYQASENHPFVDLDVPPGALVDWTPLFLTPVDPVFHEIEAVPDTVPATYYFQVRRYDRQPLSFGEPAAMAMSFSPETGDQILGLFQVTEDGSLKPYPAEIIPDLGLLFTTIVEDGIWVALREDRPPAPIPGDLNGSGTVDGADLAILLGAWGPCSDCDDCDADLDDNCAVDGADLAILLGNWG